MSACTQPACTGAIEDGYCNVCGMAAATSEKSVAASPSTKTGTSSTRTGSGRTPSTRSNRSTRSTRTGTTRSNRSASRALGGRPLARAPLPPQDPLAAIVAGVVPERKRYCSNCDSLCKREEGFCSKCGQEYSFKPSLSAGSVVAEKYEIKGTIAFGGLGWIYLALDTVLNRWVIMKGLLNSKDPKMIEVAVQEREYLASVKHPNIVGIYDFLTQGTEGFIVMEYVNGKTLMTLRKEKGEPLPVAEACSYIAEILPAFQYLDEMGLVYCDFKPENVMVEEDTVKLIDLGAVRRADDTGGDVYGSKGYIAPEAGSTPSHLSDLYSVARALAVMVASFDFQGKYEHSLPPQDEVPIFKQHDGLYRFLKKATRDKPEERFQSAGEMAEQLVGVLQSIVGRSPDMGRVESALFDPDSDPEIESGHDHRHHDGFPRVKVDRADAAAGIILAASALGDPARRLAMFERALRDHPDSVELRLRAIDELVKLARFADAELLVQALGVTAKEDWRLAWSHGRSLLAQGKVDETLAIFEGIANELPGELAPKQALGRAFEARGELEKAIGLYDLVSRADDAFVNASIGLARCLEKTKDKTGAAEAYKRVPPTSHRFAHAQMALARLMLGAEGSAPSLDDLQAAATAFAAAEGTMDGGGGLEVHELRAEIFAKATRALGSNAGNGGELLGAKLDPVTIAAEAEKAFRACARMVEDEAMRFAFVDRANQVRPFTIV